MILTHIKSKLRDIGYKTKFNQDTIYNLETSYLIYVFKSRNITLYYSNSILIQSKYYAINVM